MAQRKRWRKILFKTFANATKNINVSEFGISIPYTLPPMGNNYLLLDWLKTRLLQQRDRALYMGDVMDNSLKFTAYDDKRAKRLTPRTKREKAIAAQAFQRGYIDGQRCGSDQGYREGQREERRHSEELLCRAISSFTTLSISNHPRGASDQVY